MGKKFLIIDDSALMRRTISDIIKLNSDYELIDTANNGLEGLDRIVARPAYYDLIILDINMPKMNGLEMLEMLNKNHMHEAVVVVSTVAKEGAAETMKALELGAIDFLTKPENFFEVRGDTFKDRLMSLINVVTGSDINKSNLIEPDSTRSCDTVQERKQSPAAKRLSACSIAQDKIPKQSSARQDGRYGKIIAVACSTGGPKSLQSIIPVLPADLDAPVVLVQHMPKGFTLSLARRLDSLSRVSVKEAQDGDVLTKGNVYIAPGGMHIRVSYENNKHVIRYDDRPYLDGLKPCANVMYESLIESNYEHIVCVVLTGMGSDGTKGIRALKNSGKKIYTISQDAASSVVYGMPRSIFEAGLSDEVQPLSKIAESITRKVGVH